MAKTRSSQEKKSNKAEENVAIKMNKAETNNQQLSETTPYLNRTDYLQHKKRIEKDFTETISTSHELYIAVVGSGA